MHYVEILDTFLHKPWSFNKTKLLVSVLLFGAFYFFLRIMRFVIHYLPEVSKIYNTIYE